MWWVCGVYAVGCFGFGFWAVVDCLTFILLALLCFDLSIVCLLCWYLVAVGVDGCCSGWLLVGFAVACGDFGLIVLVGLICVSGGCLLCSLVVCCLLTMGCTLCGLVGCVSLCSSGVCWWLVLVLVMLFCV